MERISFVLPGIPYKCSGGSKVVFIYANELTKIGYDVTLYFLTKNTFTKYHFPEALRKCIINQFVRSFPKNNELNYKIQKKSIQEINDLTIQDSDFIFATSANTAYPIWKLNESKGKKIYFIQDYENWGKMSEEDLNKTYGLMTNVVIAKWLKDIVDKYSQKESVLISNSINSEYFHVVSPIEQRNRLSVAALFHQAEHKGFKHTWKAIEIIKRKYPELVVNIFGMPSKPKWFPDWVNYTSNASYAQLQSIYNASSLFLCGSINEGFGLTGAEAMACGCVLVSSDYLGVHEYATDKYNCLLSPVKDVEAMVANVEMLFNDDSLRMQLAENGVKSMKGRTWEKATHTLVSEVLKDGE